jgi:hypothetical protein
MKMDGLGVGTLPYGPIDKEMLDRMNGLNARWFDEIHRPLQ